MVSSIAMNSRKKKLLACGEAEREEPVMPGLWRIFKGIQMWSSVVLYLRKLKGNSFFLYKFIDIKLITS